jgi:hypothetical protein
MIPKACDPYRPLRPSVLGIGNSVGRNDLVFHAGFSCHLEYDMVLIVRVRSYSDVDVSMNFKSWTASPSFELSTVRTHLLVVGTVAASLTA